ncbi:hypothetical protein [Tomitella fengzijianii]|uniref:Uncharacterized protein n=1 Tax=Tomitella fengzijianii TaxID=2597660 RepID=A0A516X4G9_9ACTN|nr:hypothetical protein [Tomitella fengzijianii]QDQ97972.1 hypothetical protein FO059_12415 [Tomitella fengzijianii]
MGDDELLDLTALAERVGWTRGTAGAFHRASAKRRRDGTVKAGDLPEPDLVLSRVPAWHTSTIEQWEATRPGRGRGARPGRRKNSDNA